LCSTTNENERERERSKEREREKIISFFVVTWRQSRQQKAGRRTLDTNAYKGSKVWTPPIFPDALDWTD
jgi:hypothetical protein